MTLLTSFKVRVDPSSSTLFYHLHAIISRVISDYQDQVLNLDRSPVRQTRYHCTVRPYCVCHILSLSLQSILTNELGKCMVVINLTFTLCRYQIDLNLSIKPRKKSESATTPISTDRKILFTFLIFLLFFNLSNSQHVAIKLNSLLTL